MHTIMQEHFSIFNNMAIHAFGDGYFCGLLVKLIAGRLLGVMMRLLLDGSIIAVI